MKSNQRWNPESDESVKEAKAFIVQARQWLRWYLTQEGDDGCYLDVADLGELLPGFVFLESTTEEEHVGRCEKFHRNRTSLDGASHFEIGRFKIPDLTDDAFRRNEDLLLLSQYRLVEEARRVERNLWRFVGIPEAIRSREDQLELRKLLPEKLEPTLSLPPREVFLPNCRQFYNALKPIVIADWHTW